MYILRQKLCPSIVGKLTFNPSYQAYIHLQDHDKKVNPKQTRLHLSFMSPRQIVENVPSNPEFKAKLRKSAEQQVRKRMFEQYKQKILKGKVDEEQIIEPDTLWGEGQKPVHYYLNLSSKKANRVSHSIFKDIQSYQNELVRGYVQKLVKTTSIDGVKQLSQLAEVAASYRLNGIEDRSKYYEIQKLIGNKFHLLSDQALVLLKYAFVTTPKMCTPEFNTILNDLLSQSLPNLSVTDLTFLMYFNRHDLFRLHKRNLQISILQQVSTKFNEFSLSNKIDFLFLFIDSRSPTIRPEAHNRHTHEIRNRVQQIMCLLNIEGDFSSLSELSILKLAYSLVRGKTIHTEHLTLSIEEYITQNMDKISIKNLSLLFIYLCQIEGGKSISNLQFLQNLKQKIITSWGQISDLDKLRALNAMYQMNLYDQATHLLYTQIPIQADSTMLSMFCRLEMMNSSGRQWEVIHRLVDLEYVPLPYFQDYKRFYNYVSSIAPEWNLEAVFQKIENTEVFYSSVRYQSISQDKKTYKGLRQFQKFSGTKQLPHKFKMGCPIKNVQFAQFCLPHYQISVDIITDLERIRGTNELKGSYKLKVRNLECIGWKQLYVMQQDIEKLSYQQFFDYLQSVCEPHFEQQLQVIAAHQQYRSYVISQIKIKKEIGTMKMRQRQLYEVTKDFTNIPLEYNLIQREISQKQKIARDNQDGGKGEGEEGTQQAI